MQVDKLFVIDPQLFASFLWAVIFAESEQPRSLGICQSFWHRYGSSQLSASQSSDGRYQQVPCSWSRCLNPCGQDWCDANASSKRAAKKGADCVAGTRKRTSKARQTGQRWWLYGGKLENWCQQRCQPSTCRHHIRLGVWQTHVRGDQADSQLITTAHATVRCNFLQCLQTMNLVLAKPRAAINKSLRKRIKRV